MSELLCFKAECESFSRSDAGCTEICLQNKCKLSNLLSQLKCLPTPSPRSGKNECSSRNRSSECHQRSCTNGKCTDGTNAWLNLCFLDKCQPCSSNDEWIRTQRLNKKCTFLSAASRCKCFRTDVAKNECEISEQASDYEQGKCERDKCTKGSSGSFRSHPLRWKIGERGM